MSLGVRGRTTLVAVLAFAVAVALASVALVVILRESLVDEVDRSVENRANDIFVQVEGDLGFSDPGFGVDNDTFGAVYVLATAEVVVSSDRGADGGILDDTVTDFGVAFGVSLDHLSETNGTGKMRAIALLSPDQSGEEPGVDADGFVAGDLVVYVASSLDSVDRTVGTVRTAAILAAPLLTALVGLLVWLVAGRALRPVDVMRAEVDEISATDLDRRVAEPRTTDAIGRLATTMNQMLDRLEASQGRQQQFVADASHELRSPLASMQTQLDVDLAHPGSASWQSTAASLRVETARLQQLVDDLLLLARRDSGELMPGTRLVDLDDVVLETVGPDTDTSAVSAGLVRGDEEQLRRVAVNLVANAHRHADATVAVGVRDQDGIVMFWVDDDGRGVPVDDRRRVFERFIRLDEARNRDGGGSGLGLAISAEIVAAHGGSIAVDDSPLGGARFTVRLPSAS